MKRANAESLGLVLWVLLADVLIACAAKACGLW